MERTENVEERECRRDKMEKRERMEERECRRETE